MNISQGRIERALEAFEDAYDAAKDRDGHQFSPASARREAVAVALEADAPALAEAERKGRIEGLREGLREGRIIAESHWRLNGLLTAFDARFSELEKEEGR